MKRIGAFITILILTSLACQLPLRRSATPEPTPIPVSTEAAGQVEDQLATAAAELEQTGSVTITFTEAQITSYIANKMIASNQDFFQNPQVLLQDGAIDISGQAKIGMLSSKARLVLEPYADQGNLYIRIRSGKFGSIPVPDATLQSLSETINQNLNELITVNGQKFWLESIQISNGTMTLSGRRG
jgi:hypothetical protein